MLKIIISPAKKMIDDTDSLESMDKPYFLEKTEYLKNLLCSKTYAELKKLWRCNDQIATLNYERLQSMNLTSYTTPAILSYSGIQYQYMAPSVFDVNQFDYIQKHLVILSGFYGAVRPFDSVVPYRLEMQAKLKGDNFNNLYDFWKDDLYKFVTADSKTIINLASEEYSKCISKYVTDGVRFVTCTFGDLIDGKVVEKGTKCKMARGEMVRFMAENNVEDVEKIKEFACLDYICSAEYSTENNIVFIQTPKNKKYEADF